MKPKLPGDCKTEEEFVEFIEEKVIECLAYLKNKDETVKHLLDEFQIKPEYTTKLWDKFEEADPDYFIEYNTELEKHRKNLRTREYINDVYGKIKVCIGVYKSKEETEEHLLDQFRIRPEITRSIWDHLEKKSPDFFRKYNTDREHNRRVLERDRKIRERNAPTSKPVEEDSTKEKELKKKIHYAQHRIEECMSVYMSKGETIEHLWDEFEIRPELTTAIWYKLEKDDPDSFSKYNAVREHNRRVLEHYRKIRERNAPTSTTAEAGTSNTELGKRPTPMANEQEQQQQQRPFPPARRLTESTATDSSEEVQARKKQRTQQLQDSQQAVSSPTECVDLWKQILSTVTRIADTSEQMLKLMTDAKSREKQQVEQEHVRGDNEQAENLQDQDQNTQRMDTEKGNETSEDSSTK